jgi:tRNA (cmo5U34)-methyltransferase
LPLQERQKLLRSIYKGLTPGGLLFLSEKIKSAYPQFQETITLHYEAFKSHNGYAHTEIERKRGTRECLVPLTEAQQVQMLYESGFEQVESLLKLHNFISFVALK